MPKSKYKNLNFLPKSFNFSEIEPDEDGNILDGDSFNDNGDEVRQTESSLFTEQVILQVLFNLKDREKIVFMYQLLRESGFEIDYTSCADTIGIQRQSYMKTLSIVKKKASVIIASAYSVGKPKTNGLSNKSLTKRGSYL